MADQILTCPFPSTFTVDAHDTGAVEWTCTDPFSVDLTTPVRVHQPLIPAVLVAGSYVARYGFGNAKERVPYVESVTVMAFRKDGGRDDPDGPPPPPNTVIVVTPGM